ncbi:MAG: MiaB-like tRNA modifying enzyme [Cenarchaeum symbiont of Oopsacas minuta]|nr:MiaB-like tRNA modifying enzyme [Cenarchaeum symbiont of Oopsacas minuta]
MAKVWVEAYGCSASFADSEMISGIVTNGGHVLAESEDDADASILVTCSVKDSTAGRMAYRIKKLGGKPLLVAGCLAKAEPYTVSKLAPKASLMGPSSIGGTLHLLDGALRGQKNIELGDNTRKVGLPKVRLNPAVGIVEIASGCMSECTFCQTKFAKGKITSYRVGEIVRQIKEEISSGCSEIWLSSTDNGCYGFDIGSDLPELINAVTTIRGNFMIRVGMMNPMYIPKIHKDLLHSYQSSKVYKFMHIPVQSGSNSVLADMKRGHTATTFTNTVCMARENFEKFTISTDIIVGFPTESDDDFEDTVSLLKNTKPEIVNISKYSARPGTDAANMKQIDASIIKRRSKKITDIVSKITLESNKKWIGWSGKVLFTEDTGNGIRGRNYAYKPIYVSEGAKIGLSCMVKITGSTTNSLLGKIEG